MEKGTSRMKRMKTELFCNGGQGFILDFSRGGGFPRGSPFGMKPCRLKLPRQLKLLTLSCPLLTSFLELSLALDSVGR